MNNSTVVGLSSLASVLLAFVAIAIACCPPNPCVCDPAKQCACEMPAIVDGVLRVPAKVNGELVYQEISLSRGCPCSDRCQSGKCCACTPSASCCTQKACCKVKAGDNKPAACPPCERHVDIKLKQPACQPLRRRGRR